MALKAGVLGQPIIFSVGWASGLKSGVLGYPIIFSVGWASDLKSVVLAWGGSWSALQEK